jgi:hypothetical protein
MSAQAIGLYSSELTNKLGDALYDVYYACYKQMLRERGAQLARVVLIDKGSGKNSSGKDSKDVHTPKPFKTPMLTDHDGGSGVVDIKQKMRNRRAVSNAMTSYIRKKGNLNDFRTLVLRVADANESNQSIREMVASVIQSFDGGSEALDKYFKLFVSSRVSMASSVNPNQRAIEVAMPAPSVVLARIVRSSATSLVPKLQVVTSAVHTRSKEHEAALIVSGRSKFRELIKEPVEQVLNGFVPFDEILRESDGIAPPVASLMLNNGQEQQQQQQQQGLGGYAASTIKRNPFEDVRLLSGSRSDNLGHRRAHSDDDDDDDDGDDDDDDDDEGSEEERLDHHHRGRSHRRDKMNRYESRRSKRYDDDDDDRDRDRGVIEHGNVRIHNRERHRDEDQVSDGGGGGVGGRMEDLFSMGAGIGGVDAGDAGAAATTTNMVDQSLRPPRIASQIDPLMDRPAQEQQQQPEQHRHTQQRGRSRSPAPSRSLSRSPDYRPRRRSPPQYQSPINDDSGGSRYESRRVRRGDRDDRDDRRDRDRRDRRR